MSKMVSNLSLIFSYCSLGIFKNDSELMSIDLNKLKKLLCSTSFFLFFFLTVFLVMFFPSFHKISVASVFMGSSSSFLQLLILLNYIGFNEYLQDIIREIVILVKMKDDLEVSAVVRWVDVKFLQWK
jgi:hypothetical protein